MQISNLTWKVKIECEHSICFKCVCKQQNQDEVFCQKCDALKKIKDENAIIMLA